MEHRSRVHKTFAERRKTSSDTSMSPKLLVVFSVLLVVAQAHLLPTHRTFGGTAAGKNEFPYQISLQIIDDEPDITKHVCGGCILSDQWVLTAAHCVDDSENDSWKVLAGTNNNIHLGDDAQVVSVAMMIVHESWKKKGQPYDLALLKLKTPLKLNKAVSSISLPKFKAKASGYGTISGFGETKESNGEASPTLKKANVLIMDHEKCTKVAGLSVAHPKEICTSAGDGIPVSPCVGDSGGPLAQKKPSGITELLGVVVWGEYPCGEGAPSVYVNVAEFVDWIEATMKKN